MHKRTRKNHFQSTYLWATAMNSIPRVWIIDDDQSIRWVLQKALQKAGVNVRSFSNGKDLLDVIKDDVPDVIVSDVRMPNIDGLDLMNRVQTIYPDLPVIIMTAHSDLESAVSAFHGGAFEYLPKPFDLNDAVDLVRRACSQAKRKILSDAENPCPPLPRKLQKSSAKPRQCRKSSEQSDDSPVHTSRY